MAIANSGEDHLQLAMMKETLWRNALMKSDGQNMLVMAGDLTQDGREGSTDIQLANPEEKRKRLNFERDGAWVRTHSQWWILIVSIEQILFSHPDCQILKDRDNVL